MQALLNAIANMALSTDAQRVFHGRGGLYPGCEQWALDAFPPVLVVTSFQTVSEEDLATIDLALSQRWSQIGLDTPLNWVFQCRAEGHLETRLMRGAVPDPHVVTENGSRFRVHVLKGQNHGLFLDMAEGREWVRRWVGSYAPDQPRLKVLNLFAYTCAFSVVALKAGAKLTVNVDMSHGAMAIGQQNHPLNGISTGATFLMHDIFKTWGKITRSGPYGLVIVDPPSYQKGSFIATKDYAKLMRRLPELLAPGGYALLCLNAPELGLDFLQDQMQELAPELKFVERVANPAAFADVSPERSLKVLAYQMPSLSAQVSDVSGSEA
jgi:23S rRNA (cytosine1962-C5)-methyltransferase